MVLSPAINNIQNNGCGTINKCSVCNFKLICDKSPYCMINKINNVDLTQSFEPLKNQLDSVMSGLSTINNNLMVIDSGNKNILLNISKINENLVSLGNNITELNDIISKSLKVINENSDEIKDVTDDTTVENYDINNSDVVPYTNEPDTVLVEKKSIFGKSKWVEKKI